MTDHYVYVLRCGDGTLYTGYTTDVQRRVSEHRAGDGAKYTRGRTPLELVYVEPCDSRSAAMGREHEIKSMRREQKEEEVESAPDPAAVLEDWSEGTGGDEGAGGGPGTGTGGGGNG